MADFKFIRYETDQTISSSVGNTDCRVKALISLVFDDDGASGKYGVMQTVQPPNINTEYIQVYLKYNQNYSPAIGGEVTLDGIELLTGDKVWLSNQTDPLENGIYSVTASAWTYVRPVNNELFVDLGARAYDTLDGDLSRSIVTQQEIDFSKAGFYTIKYYVVNSMGVLSSVSRRVKIINTNASIMPTTPFNITDLQINTEYDKNLFNQFPPRGSTSDCDACGPDQSSDSNSYIRKDGIVTFTNDQSMNGNHITSLGTAVHELDAVNLMQLQAMLNTSTDLSNISGTHVAGQSIDAYQVVYINSNGMVYPANTTDVTQMNRIVGITVASGTLGGSISVAIAGVLTGLSSLNAGAYYFFDENGILTTTTPSIGFRQIVGIAISETSLLVNIRVPVGI